MHEAGTTWSCDEITDARLLDELPPELAHLLIRTNGWILHHGLLHVRGVVKEPSWHSLRRAWTGVQSFHLNYPDLLVTDVPFAQDLFGDQFLLRQGRVLVLSGETGEIKEKESSLDVFLRKCGANAAEYLNASSEVKLRPGELLFAFPPFFVAPDGDKSSHLKPCPAEEVIAIHADIARQIRELPDGTEIEFKYR